MLGGRGGRTGGLLQELEVRHLVHKGLFIRKSWRGFLFLFQLMDFVALRLVNQLAVIKQGKDDDSLNNVTVFCAPWRGVVCQGNLLRKKRELSRQRGIYHAQTSPRGCSLPPRAGEGLLRRSPFPDSSRSPSRLSPAQSYLLSHLPVSCSRNPSPARCGQSQPEQLKQLKQ